MFQIVQPVIELVNTRPAPQAQAVSEPALTFTRDQWAAFNNGMLAEMLLQQDGEDPRILRSQWSGTTQEDFDRGRARMRALLTDTGWTL